MTRSIIVNFNHCKFVSDIKLFLLLRFPLRSFVLLIIRCFTCVILLVLLLHMFCPLEVWNDEFRHDEVFNDFMTKIKLCCVCFCPPFLLIWTKFKLLTNCWGLILRKWKKNTKWFWHLRVVETDLSFAYFILKFKVVCCNSLLPFFIIVILSLYRIFIIFHLMWPTDLRTPTNKFNFFSFSLLF